MTAPPDRDRATRDRLAEALSDAWVTGTPPRELADRYADALLPVVAELVREGQAEALRAAADSTDGCRRYGGLDLRADIADDLRDRAVALRARRAGGTL